MAVLNEVMLVKVFFGMRIIESGIQPMKNSSKNMHVPMPL
jgi:hypothetical protein